jgi:hypothetical protein
MAGFDAWDEKHNPAKIPQQWRKWLIYKRL